MLSPSKQQPSHRIFVCSGRKTRWESSPSQDQQQRLQDNAERKTSSSSSWLLNLLGFPGKLLGPGQNQARECVRLKKKNLVSPHFCLFRQRLQHPWWGNCCSSHVRRIGGGGGIWWSKVQLSIYFGDASSSRMAGLVFFVVPL